MQEIFHRISRIKGGEGVLEKFWKRPRGQARLGAVCCGRFAIEKGFEQKSDEKVGPRSAAFPFCSLLGH